MIALLKKFAPQITVATLAGLVGALGKYGVLAPDVAASVLGVLAVFGTHVAKGMQP